MRVARQDVSTALFALLSNAYAGFNTADQRLQIPTDMAALAQPAIFLVKPRENTSQSKTFGLPIYMLKYYAVVFVRADQTPSDTTAEAVMDTIIDAFEVAFGTSSGITQTLGGLVTNAWIDGDTTFDTPALFPQGAALVPITVLVGA